MEGVLRDIAKCTAVGPPWVHVHHQTGIIEFVIIQFGWQERFTNCWKEYTRQVIKNEPMEAEPIAGPSGITDEQKAAASEQADQAVKKKAAKEKLAAAEAAKKQLADEKKIKAAEENCAGKERARLGPELWLEEVVGMEVEVEAVDRHLEGMTRMRLTPTRIPKKLPRSSVPSFCQQNPAP